MDPSIEQQQEMGNSSKAKPSSPAEEAVKCPRCDSGNTKFCYYNNRSLSQPRYFCKSCKRYWTKGGNLRNVPVGSGCRKRISSSSKKTQNQTLTPNTNPLIKTSPSFPPTETQQQPQPQFKPSIPISFDHNKIGPTNDTTLAFSRHPTQYDHHVLGNPSLHVPGNFNNFHGFCHVGPSVGFNGETMMLYNYINEDTLDSTALTTTTTLDVSVPTLQQDNTENRSVLWDLPWQLIADADDNNNSNNIDIVVPADFDSVGDNWDELLNNLLI